jgi:cytochrome c-type biogenesis protein CcmH/NrfG
MSGNRTAGFVKSENVIWIVAAALLAGFLAGAAVGVYKTGTIADPHRPAQPGATDAARQQAIEMLKAQTDQNPQDIAGWIQLGHHYFDANLPKEAVRAYETALALDPQNADVWTDLGVMYRRSGSPEKAVEAFDRAMGLDPEHQISRYNKGIVLFHDLEDAPGALEAWEALLAINPDAQTPGGQTVRQMVDHIRQEHPADP